MINKNHNMETPGEANFDRYSRQRVYEKIGDQGQKKISSARVAIIGIGALGTVMANNLCRSGVGYLRLIDRDHVELSNLQRQVLMEEEDAAAGLPKALAAFQHLSRINSGIKMEPVVTHVDSSNIEDLIKDMDVILDGTDNMETRFIINEACYKLKKPWVRGGVLAAGGNCMTIIPGEGPCFRCLMPDSGTRAFPTTAARGVLNMASNIIASMESAEALKIITGSKDLNRRLFLLDLWNNTAEYIEIVKNPGCPVCGN